MGTGSAAPANRVTNTMLAQLVDTSDEWIVSRTGIRERRIAQSETTLSLDTQAAQYALQAAGIRTAGSAPLSWVPHGGVLHGGVLQGGQHGGEPHGGQQPAAAPLTPSITDVDTCELALIICATVTAEQSCPSLACLLQRALGLPQNILTFDLNAACSGFIYALITAQSLLRPGQYALVVGSEVLSHVVDFTDRNTCVLFGDGAGAAVVTPSGAPFRWTAAAQGGDELLSITRYIHMDGPAVFRFAVESLVSSVREVCAQGGIDVTTLDQVICHQANERIITSAARRLELPPERFFMNLDRYGNTSAASIPLAIDEAVRAGAIAPGQQVVLAGFGGGLTSGAIYLVWE
jgi:3-oxoacyl-[acyl-carrier-protein] synthase-3